MYVCNMVPTDYITLDDKATLVLDSIINDGSARYLHLKLFQDNNTQDIQLYKNISSELTLNGKSFPIEARKIQPSCGRVYFSDDYNDIKITYHKGIRKRI